MTRLRQDRAIKYLKEHHDLDIKPGNLWTYLRNNHIEPKEQVWGNSYALYTTSEQLDLFATRYTPRKNHVDELPHSEEFEETLRRSATRMKEHLSDVMRISEKTGMSSLEASLQIRRAGNWGEGNVLCDWIGA